MSDWIKWNGGLCPVTGDKLVDVKLRDGSQHNAMQAVWWSGFGPTHDHWFNGSSVADNRDIVEYRLSTVSEKRP